MPILTTCAALATVLASARGGETIALQGNCPSIAIQRQFPAMVTIDASKATVRGLQITGANVSWRGGTLQAADGLDGFARKGYALEILRARNVRVTGATITAAKKGLVIHESEGVVVEGNKFWRLREDGIIASRTRKLDIDRNEFSETQPLPTECRLPDGTVQKGKPRRDCKGVFKDGNHADAIQVYDGIEDLRIRDNRISGDTQGIGQMGGPKSAPMKRVLIEGNDVAGAQWHQISLYNCIECEIRNNKVRRGREDRRVRIIPAGARRCGNTVQDEPSDGRCR